MKVDKYERKLKKRRAHIENIEDSVKEMFYLSNKGNQL